MGATLAYELKQVMPILCEMARWNVLTVFILHANVRNRCWPDTDTLSTMGANGNRNKALDAKQWLLEHKAIELVPFGKRMDEERALPNRQHVYQLTGYLELSDQNGQVRKVKYLYIQDAVKSIDGETKTTSESIDGETLTIRNSIDVNSIGVESIGVETRSITSSTLPNETEKQENKDSTVSVEPVPPTESTRAKNAPVQKRKAKTEDPETSKAIAALIKAWVDATGTLEANPYRKTGYRATAKNMHAAGITPADAAAFVQWKRQNDKFYATKQIPFGLVAAEIANWKRNGHAAPPKTATPAKPKPYSAEYHRLHAIEQAELQKAREEAEAERVRKEQEALPRAS